MGKKIKTQTSGNARLQATTDQKQASLPLHETISAWGQVACPALLLGWATIDFFFSFFSFFCIGASFDLKPMTLWNASNLERVIFLTYYLDEQQNSNGMIKKTKTQQRQKHIKGWRNHRERWFYRKVIKPQPLWTVLFTQHCAIQDWQHIHIFKATSGSNNVYWVFALWKA